MREDRSETQPRPVSVETGIIPGLKSSVIYHSGKTTILCVAKMEEGTPRWRTGPAGWATAEYQMAPYSVSPRMDRQSSTPDGRSLEIRRLISRAIRGGLDLGLMPGYSLKVDCDVLHADGGTRTASINAATIAIGLLVEDQLSRGILATDPRRDQVLAISAGIVDGKVLVDLEYSEDSRADVDMNLVGTRSGDVIEIAGGCEGLAIPMESMQKVLEAAQEGLQALGEQLSPHLFSLTK